jgi:hypothetical protein
MYSKITKYLYDNKANNDLNYQNDIIYMLFFKQNTLPLDGSSVYASCYPALYAILQDICPSLDNIMFNIPDYRGAGLRNFGSVDFDNGKSSIRPSNPNTAPVGAQLNSAKNGYNYVTNIRNLDHTHELFYPDLFIKDIHTHSYDEVIVTHLDFTHADTGVYIIKDIFTPFTSSNPANVKVTPNSWNFTATSHVADTIAIKSLNVNNNLPTTLPLATGSNYEIFDSKIGSCACNDLYPSSISCFYLISF